MKILYQNNYEKKQKNLLTNIWDYEISWMPLFHLNMVIAVAIRLFLSMWPLTFGIWPLLFLTQSPPKGATIQYRPKPVVPPVIFAGGQAYTVPGQMQGVQASEVSHHSPVCGLCVFLFWMEFRIQRKETCSWCIAYLLNNYWPYWKSFVMGWILFLFLLNEF